MGLFQYCLYFNGVLYEAVRNQPKFQTPSLKKKLIWFSKGVAVDVFVYPTADADIGKIKEFEKLQNQWCM